MNYSIRWDISIMDVSSSKEMMTFIDEHSKMYNNWGTRGSTLWIGPEGTKRREMPLRIDIDPDAGAAAIRWLPDNLVGIHSTDFNLGPIKVAESSDRDLVTIPANLVRASIDAAKKVAAEYIETGQRPTYVDWMPID